MLRYYQKALKELEKSSDKHQEVGELEELHQEQDLADGRKLKKYDKQEKERDKKLRKEKKKKKAMEDLTTIDHDLAAMSEVRKKKKKKKKKRRHLDIDTGAKNSSGRERFKSQYDTSRVSDSSVVSNSKEVTKKRKRESLTELSDGAVKKSKHSEKTSKSHKHRDKEKWDEMHGIITSDQRTENVDTSLESSTLEQRKHSSEISPRTTHHSKESSLSGKEHVSKGEDPHQKKRKKRKDNVTMTTAVDGNNLMNGNDTEVVKSRVEPIDTSNIKIDKEKLKKATVISNKIHETWTLVEESLKKLAEEGIKVKRGKWSIQELDLLKFNMAHFLERYNLEDPNPLLFRSGMDKEEIKYWKRFVRNNDFYKELGKGIHRELFSIYKCATRIFDANNYVGRYTEDEVKDLKRLHTIHGSDWVTIGQLMGRSRMSVNRKNSKLPLTCTPKGQGDKLDPNRKWTVDELKRLNEAVHLVTNTSEEQPVFHGIDWQGVAQIVKTRGAETCRKKWLNKLCWSKVENETKTKWTKNHDIKLITRLYNSGVTEECDVDWMEMKSEYDIDYSPQWLREKWAKLKKNVPNYQQLSFEDIVDYLHRIYGQTLRDNLQAETVNDETE